MMTHICSHVEVQGVRLLRRLAVLLWRYQRPSRGLASLLCVSTAPALGLAGARRGPAARAL
eukprot:13292255-Heterocapsa_arctica.AAC.1